MYSMSPLSPRRAAILRYIRDQVNGHGQAPSLAEIAAAWTEYLHQCKQQGLHFIQPGRFVLPGDMAGAPALQFFPWPDVDAWGESKLAQADKHTNAGMLRDRFNYYCEKVVKGFYKNHFLRFDRQIVLVDCLQPLNSGPLVSGVKSIDCSSL